MIDFVFISSFFLLIVSVIVIYNERTVRSTYVSKLKALRYQAGSSDERSNQSADIDLNWALQNGKLVDSLFDEELGGDLDDVVSALIDSGADVNARDTRGIPAVFMVLKSSIIKDEISIIKKMGRAGCDFNAMDPDGNTVLFGLNDIEIAEWLIEHGAVIDAQNAEGKTPLHVAKSLDMVECLLNHGANPNICDHFGRTPLFYIESRDCAHALIRAGADVDIVDNEGNRATLLKKIDKPPVYEPKSEHYDNSLNEELYWAVRDDDLSGARDLLQRGANPNKACDYTSILYISESEKMHELLCSFRADPNQVVKTSNPPMISAIYHRKSWACRVLIRYGAKSDDGDIRDCIYNNAPECLRVLLESGLIVNSDSWNYAVSHGYADVIELLEEYSDFRLSFEEAPTLELKMRIARKNGQKLSDGDKTKLLKQLYTDSNRNENLAKAVKKGDIEGVRLLLEQGANPNYYAEYDTMLTEACSGSQSEIVELLCAAGADVNGKNQFGLDPWSRSEYSPKCREILKKYGVKPR